MIHADNGQKTKLIAKLPNVRFERERVSARAIPDDDKERLRELAKV
jgi:hypothetical protein